MGQAVGGIVSSLVGGGGNKSGGGGGGIVSKVLETVSQIAGALTGAK